MINMYMGSVSWNDDELSFFFVVFSLITRKSKADSWDERKKIIAITINKEQRIHKQERIDKEIFTYINDVGT